MLTISVSIGLKFDFFYLFGAINESSCKTSKQVNLKRSELQPASLFIIKNLAIKITEEQKNQLLFGF